MTDKYEEGWGADEQGEPPVRSLTAAQDFLDQVEGLARAAQGVIYAASTPDATVRQLAAALTPITGVDYLRYIGQQA